MLQREKGVPPRFLLGTGAQKAGTTWFYRHLKRSTGFVAGFRKEYHVLDVAEVPEQTYMRQRVLDLAESSLAHLRGSQEGRPEDAHALHRVAMIADRGVYLDYFTALLARPGALLTADMTPENALVPSERLRDLRAGFVERGVGTAALLLMRDPVDRIWSQVRMQHHRTPDRFREPPAATLQRVYAQPQYEVRTRYDQILMRLEQAFPAEELTTGFYEQLFEPDEVARICSRLGVESRPPRTEQRANASPGGDDELPRELRAEVAAHYREVYEYVATHLGVDVERLWPSSRLG